MAAETATLRRHRAFDGTLWHAVIPVFGDNGQMIGACGEIFKRVGTVAGRGQDVTCVACIADPTGPHRRAPKTTKHGWPGKVVP